MCVRMNKDVIHTYFCYFKSKGMENSLCIHPQETGVLMTQFCEGYGIVEKQEIDLSWYVMMFNF